MELCTTCAVSTPPFPTSFHGFLPNSSHLRFGSSSRLNKSTHFPVVLSHRSTLLRATSEETSSEASYFKEERSDAVATLQDVPSVDNDVTLDKVSPVNESVYNETRQPEPPQVEESSSNEAMQPLKEFLEKLNIKLEDEDSSKILLYGGGAIVALWLLSVIIGAIDSIPVFPKLMEVVGLGYSVWFTTRYLLFKKNREELFSKIEELKQEILGSSDN